MIARAGRRICSTGVPPVHRSDRAADFLACLERVDTDKQATAQDVRELYAKGLE